MKNTTSQDNNLFDGTSLRIQQSASKQQCSGKGCTQIAKNLLTILYINKRGYFCDACTKDLVATQLAVRIQEVIPND